MTLILRDYVCSRQDGMTNAEILRLVGAHSLEIPWNDGGLDRFETSHALPPYLDQLADLTAPTRRTGIGATLNEGVGFQQLIETAYALGGRRPRGERR